MRRLSSGFGWASSLKSALAVTATLAAVGCSGGGCSSGCGGSSVIPKGFPKENRVTNAAGVRLTRPGIDFLQANLAPIIQKILTGGGGTIKDGVMTFPISESKSDVKDPLLGIKIGTLTVCPGGPDPAASPPKCIVEINIGGIKDIKINSINPHDVTVAAKIPIRLRNLPLDVPLLGGATAGLGVGSDCGTLDYVDVPTTADISLEKIPNDALHAARADYTKINIKTIDFDKKPVEDNFKFCGGGIKAFILNLIKGIAVGGAIGGLTDRIAGPLQDATCMKAQKLDDGTEQCPSGTFNRSGTCRYEDKDGAECVPMLLGLESRFDLSGLLASLSPGTSGGLDFMLAAGNDMTPAPGTTPAENGVTLNMFGGAMPQPISNCVPAVPTPPLPIITDIPDELRANSITPWPAAPAPPLHLGIGLAEKHINHIAAGAYNSGLFCIGISSEQVPQLDAGLFGLLLPSLNQLSDQFKAGESHPAMGLSIRPQKPPSIKVGDGKADFSNPLLDIQLKDTDLDFYSWSEDRFVRLFTGRIDIRVPMNMEAGKDGIALKFAEKSPIQFTNPRVSNNTILLEKDAAVGKLVESIGGLIPASALGNIKPFKLDSALASFGVKLTIPPEGIKKVVNKDGDPFLGIFASLELSGAAMPTTKTSASVRSVKIDAKNFALGTTGDAPPEVDVHAQSDLDDGTRKVEYAYRVDRGPQSMFFDGRDFTVRSPFFILQGKHTIFVSSRIKGVADSEGDATALSVVIDTIKPFLAVQNVVPGMVKIVASDLVTDAQDLRVEARIDDGTWFTVNIGEVKDPKDGTHTRLDRVVAVPMEAGSIEVRATDSSGNTASIGSALIRGRSDGGLPPKSGCGCSVPGGSGDSTPTGMSAGLLAGFAVLGAIWERRRRTQNRLRSVACASALVASAGASGCTCAGGDDNGNDPPDDRPALVSYVLGSYTSAAARADGKIWVAGYNEGDPSGGTSDDYHGDLVVGLLDPATSTIEWKAIDGVPNVPPTKNHKGFRGGVTDPGDDVGLYTSMALDSKGNPVVGYFDRTNGSLRIARYDGSAWGTYELDHVDKGWAGKFTSMVNAGGKLAIAYQTLEPGSGGFAKAKVKVATATSDNPSAQGDWTQGDVTVDDKTPCVPAVCSTGQKCLAGDKAAGIDPICMATTSGCGATCADVCIKSPKDGAPTCVKGRTEIGQYVNAIGLFNSLAASPSGTLGLVFYDRVRGNIRAASNAGGKWTVTPGNAPLDGWVGDAAKDKGLGDRGIGATLAIDSSGNWHVAYVDGIKEWLLYKFVPGGDLTKAAATVTVDDGNSPDGAAANAFKDGNHLIGENAHLVVDGSTIKIVYQDSTSGTLRWAKGTTGPAPKFTHGVIKQDGYAGFWPRIVGDQVVNFFRAKGFTVVAGDETGTATGDPLITGNVRATTIP